MDRLFCANECESLATLATARDRSGRDVHQPHRDDTTCHLNRAAIAIIFSKTSPILSKRRKPLFSNSRNRRRVVATARDPSCRYLRSINIAETADQLNRAFIKVISSTKRSCDQAISSHIPHDRRGVAATAPSCRDRDTKTIKQLDEYHNHIQCE